MTTRAYDALIGIVPKLQAILVANGYLTNAGQAVLLGPQPRPETGTWPHIRLHETDAATDAANGFAPIAKFTVTFIAEAYAQQDDPSMMMASGHDLVADLQKALYGSPERDLGNAVLRINPAGYRILYPEDGSNVVVAQVRGTYSFSTKFSAP